MSQPHEEDNSKVPEAHDSAHASPFIPERSPVLVPRKRIVSQIGNEQARYVRDLYESGARLWTKEMFLAVEEELAHNPNLTKLMIPTMNGGYNEETLEVRRRHVSDPNDRLAIVYFRPYETLVYEAEEGVFETGNDQDESDHTAYHSDDEDVVTTFCTRQVGYDEDKLKDQLSCALGIGWTQAPEFLSIDYLDFKSAWDEARHNWTQSSACHELTDAFRQSCNMPKATKIVCFGLGCLEGSPSYSDLHIPAQCDGLPRRSAMTQHAAALSMAGAVGERLGTAPLRVIAQEPLYSPLAKRLLPEVGIEVVEGHGSLAFTHVDDETIVFTSCPNIPVKQIVADIAKPAAMVWNLVRPAKEGEPEWLFDLSGSREMMYSPWLTDEDSPRTRKLVEDYTYHEFPADGERFSNMAIYIRKD